MPNQDDNSLESQLNDIFSPSSPSSTANSTSSHTGYGGSSSSPVSTPTYNPTPIAPVLYPNSRGSSQSVGVNLGELLDINDYHPVMIFGTRASGKSTLLASVFNYIKYYGSKSKSMVFFGDPIVPVDTPYGKEVFEAAQEFFHNKVEYFARGLAPERTQVNAPFFIPVIFRREGYPDLKIAFLESAGEWYMPNSNLIGMYQPLKEEIESVYRSYPKSITLLLVAPFTTKAAFSHEPLDPVDSSEMRDSDSGLFNSLAIYQSMRGETQRQIDNYRFILTKWDVYSDGDIEHPDLVNPSRQLISEKISERFPKSWNIFQAMGDGKNKDVMPYSAGFIAGDDIIGNPEEIKIKMQRFPQTLLDWIYDCVTPPPRPSFFSAIKKILS
jgi:hypothetical protein